VFTSERGGPLTPKSFHTLFACIGQRAKMPFPHPSAHAAPRLWLRSGQRRSRHPPLQAYLGHKNIQHTVRYSELAADRFKNFWRL
jgi:integrase